MTYLDDTVTTPLVSIKFYTTFSVKNESPHYQKVDGYGLWIIGKTTDPQQSCTFGSVSTANMIKINRINRGKKQSVDKHMPLSSTILVKSYKIYFIVFILIIINWISKCQDSDNQIQL